MVLSDQVTVYQKGELYWADATKVVATTVGKAWQAIETALLHIPDVSTAAHEAVKVERVSEDSPLLAVGNKVLASNSMLGGIIKLPMELCVTEVEPESYIWISITVFRQHFADVDFKIEQVGDKARLSYRQGF
ncbi:MAG: hypothetical protein GY750_01845 [Lentisphaerae bacterium]|nr:hypothetical protein [Lentisphaerota bacterium]MCP4100164.1 hypothetical protein [Lentisphaerota bacterium]